MTNINTSIEECPLEAVLAEDALNESGFVVLTAGTTLTENKIKSLSKYGIDNIVIKSVTKNTQAELDEKMKKIEKYFNKKFRRCNMTYEMVELKNILINYRCRDSC